MLNANAPEFVPAAWSYYDPNTYYDEEGPLNEEELEELELMEQWVQTMADLEAAEHEHLIATALSEAEPSQILEVEMRAGAVDVAAASDSKAKHPHRKHNRAAKH